ncbi:hypothetical protein K443DRAFT_15344 [Laccaria amethystina LaAM-08-1]|uniref:Uncharacterized protein n=1 Tax=Laccaria amethystina LaAM-08-1 TaxID=1095629 RepID=A0A0C9X176_9AGAR|nr:hypothetical protein K443DRAFT_15344 [Laccaria amethystina LaAM-08-1]
MCSSDFGALIDSVTIAPLLLRRDSLIFADIHPKQLLNSWKCIQIIVSKISKLLVVY